MRKRLRRWIGRIVCALDPNWHPGFRGEIRYRFDRPVVKDQYIGGDHHTIYQHEWRYARWLCIRCSSPRPLDWPEEKA